MKYFCTSDTFRVDYGIQHSFTVTVDFFSDDEEFLEKTTRFFSDVFTVGALNDRAVSVRYVFRSDRRNFSERAVVAPKEIQVCVFFRDVCY
jgi:hypothetical protein